MRFLRRKKTTTYTPRKKVIIAVAVVLLVTLGAFVWKANSVANKITTKDGSFFSNIVNALPGSKKTLRGTQQGRINIAILGMRGKNVPGGGLLADTIMVLSIKPEEKEVSIISIPRDLYVTAPGTNTQTKINAVHFFGEEKGIGEGLESMKEILTTITGQEIHYAGSINFKGFEKIIDDIGGVEITRDTPFSEPIQFHTEQVCDQEVFTIPSGNFEEKSDERGKIVARYPLCYNEHEECDGNFELPAGTQKLDGEKALCYVRARMTSSDFDRARRQQEVIASAQKKIFSANVLTDFSKINRLMTTIGDNARTDMALWEVQEIFALYKTIEQTEFEQRVLENSAEGLLYAPDTTGTGAGYILLPRGDNYDQIHNLFDTII